MKNFALMGVSGYVAPKHLKAISDTNNNLLAALDKSDSVGIMDSYFPSSSFFTEFERFDRHIEKLKREFSILVDYVSICTPNYLHDAHIRMALRSGADVICEKPLVLNPWNVDALAAIELETGKKVYSILQLRYHKSILDLKKEVENSPEGKTFNVDLTYITSRGNWYYASWKGDISKSGGIVSNIGIHFFDILTWIFGDLKKNIVYENVHDRASGYLVFGKAKVKWFLSINYNLLPEGIKRKGERTFRFLSIDGKEINFTDGFSQLHTQSYENILKGKGFDLEDARPSVSLIHEIRNKTLSKPEHDEVHELFFAPKEDHPFFKMLT